MALATLLLLKAEAGVKLSTVYSTLPDNHQQVWALW